MEALLNSWSVPQDVIDAFKSNAIDESHLPQLTADQLKELCPIMGIRIDLGKKIAEYLEAQAPTETINAGETSSVGTGEIQEVSVLGVTGKSVTARGKLIDKVRNILHESGERKRKHDANESNDSPVVNKKPLLDTPQLELHRNDIEWLRNNREPWPEVIQKWKSTAETRQAKEYENIQDMISQWSILNSPSAVELIEEDFKYLYPDKTENFAKNWHTFFDKLSNLKKSEINSDVGRETLFASLNFIDLQDEKIPSQLQLLVQLVPPKGRYSKKDKISVQECLDSIMIIVEN